MRSYITRTTSPWMQRRTLTQKINEFGRVRRALQWIMSLSRCLLRFLRMAEAARTRLGGENILMRIFKGILLPLAFEVFGVSSKRQFIRIIRSHYLSPNKRTLVTNQILRKAQNMRERYEEIQTEVADKTMCARRLIQRLENSAWYRPAIPRSLSLKTISL